MKEVAALRPKMNNYLTADDCVGKKAKGKRKCFIKGEIKFED